MRTDTGQTVKLGDYQPTAYDAPHTHLRFVLDPEAAIVTNTTRYALADAQNGATGGPLELAGDDLTLKAVHLDGSALPADAYAATPDRFVLHRPPAAPFELTLVTEVAPDGNTQLMGLFRSSGVYCTQCEAEGFRRITYAYDRPDVLGTYTVEIVGGADTPVLLSNGNLTAETTEDGRPVARWEDPFRKATYLFALVAGDLGVARDTFTTMSGRTVALAIYVEHGKEPRAGYAMDALKRSMRWDEERFGLEYDLDMFNVVAVSDFNMGAMENKGLNVFNDRYVLADPRVATDADYAGVETVIAHEYFHNWTGNRVTCRDWFQLCLKEGLTVFRDQEFTSDERSRGVKRVADVRRLRAAQFVEDASPLRHPVRPNEYAEISNLYTATVYDKGAELVRMVHTMVGEPAFRAGMDAYFARFDGTAATMEDFLSCFPLPAAADGFMRWYEEPGTPVVAIDERFEDGRYTLSLTQTPPPGGTAKPVPVRVALLTETGAVDLSAADADGATVDRDLVILRDHATISVAGLNVAPVASVLRGLSAPVRIERTDNSARDIALMTRDDDPFNVWDAVQRRSLAAMRSRYGGEKATENEQPTTDETALADALAAVAGNETHEPAFRALVLALPTRQTLTEEIGADVDAAKVDAAYKAVSNALASAMADALAGLHDAPVPDADDNSADAAGRRALRNAALLLLSAAKNDQRALGQARAATTMTDRLAALTALSAADSDAADEAMQAFARDFDDEPLALDKYFTLEALRTGDAALERVRRLMDHPRFSRKNPNRFRSLISAFTGNYAAFHQADGSGYRFIADEALGLDAANPQVAARLLTAFGSVRRMDAPRREAADAALASVLAAAKSSDILDIARRLTRS